MIKKGTILPPKNQESQLVDASYTGVWVSRSEPHLAYKVIPKAGCSSVGQIMNFIDTGSFFDGNVHHQRSSILKWGSGKNRAQLVQILLEKNPFWFTLVRNPYTRLFSAFADKIFGYHEDGMRYRAGKIHRHLQKLGLKWDADSNLITNFRIFLKYVESNIERRRPCAPDIHWAPQFKMLKANAKHNPEFKFDFIGHIETFRPDIEEVLKRAGIDSQNIPTNIPRENSTSISKIPLSEFFGPEEIEIMLRIYAKDFQYLGYSKSPTQLKPLGSIDLEILNHDIHG